MTNTIINPNLDISTYAEEFKKNRVVVIKDFLKKEEIERLYKWFSEEMPSNWWDVSSFPSIDHDSVNFVRNEEENSEEIKKNYSYVLSKFGEGKFSYNFFRTRDNHYEDCTCGECNLRKWLVSEENLGFINQITDEKYTGSDEVFAACYTAGDFLSPHVDSPNGTLGFVLHMTKNWLPEYGGLLHFMDDERRVVERIEVPEYNSLTLFYLPENKGKWHFVSPVSPGTPEIRLTYTGWFK
jgi:Rps23 Pro-64 3,4-dihydroxylase Tpa1-like proline 4-hydroxylase